MYHAELEAIKAQGNEVRHYMVTRESSCFFGYEFAGIEYTRGGLAMVAVLKEYQPWETVCGFQLAHVQEV